MKIALLGYGKMGRLIEKLAYEQGHQVPVRFSREWGLLKARSQDLAQADIAIDFSHSSLVLDHLKHCCDHGIPLVIGTTGWDQHLEIAKKIVEEAQIGCFYAPNFSIGVFLFQQIVYLAATLFQSFDEYDVAGIESHHKHKLDAPSGTAKWLKKSILQQMPRLQDFQFTSVRCGAIPGTHTLVFDSPSDTVTLEHQARNREGFASGALLAAEWLMSRRGFYQMEDMMQDDLNYSNSILI